MQDISQDTLNESAKLAQSARSLCGKSIRHSLAVIVIFL